MKNIITPEVIAKLKRDTKELFDFYDLKGLRKSAKQKSEDISGLLENSISELVVGAVAPKVDSEPDIWYDNKAVEIKTTNGDQWRGGTFSKRAGYYLFVSWKLIEDNNLKLFISGVSLEEHDWKVSSSKNYYATSYGKKELVENHDKVTQYVGELVSYKKGKQQCIKLQFG